MEKYDEIGLNYNQTRKADPYLTSKFFQHLNPSEDKLYLDIGCGTGNYTNELSNLGFKFIGIDPSVEMLDNAKKKNSQIDWRIGTHSRQVKHENIVLCTF
jgi:ubiquinone/menaquinone biosynthesis C-methylase UbiE